MVATTRRCRSRKSFLAWHNLFLAMLPAIVTHARIAFCHLNAEARQDAVQEVVANAFVAFARLAPLGRTDLAYPGPLARYGVAQVRVSDGRIAQFQRELANSWAAFRGEDGSSVLVDPAAA